MPCCVAVNCSNRSEKGWKLYKFPKDPRRIKWILNLRRGNKWAPTDSSRLCEKHFEASQFERKRVDGWKKLKPNAIPTLFDIPNAPPMIETLPRKSLYKNSNKNVALANSKTAKCAVLKSKVNAETAIYGQESNPVPIQIDPIQNTSENKQADEIALLRHENQELQRQLQDLQAEREKSNQLLVMENQKLRKQITEMDRIRQSFLNESQIKMLEEGRMSQWPNDSIIKGLKFRFALAIHGYEYLRSTGYPLPSYSTLMRRIQELKLDFGIFKDVLQMLQFKVETMDIRDKFCVLSYDEMQISQQLDYDKNLGTFIGRATLDLNLDDLNNLGEKIYMVVVRGVKNRWKQVIACHVTRNKAIDSNLLKDFILDCIKSVESCGLYVVALLSDLDGRNRSLWSSLNIHVSRDGIRRNSFLYNDHEIFAFPDSCHLLKNLKSAMLRQQIYLPEAYVEQEGLPTNVVNGFYVKTLWDYEISNGLDKRLLHHLRREDMEPSNFEKMNVGAAVRFFSPKTFSALQTAVKNDILPHEALTTAQFILTIHEWFSIMSSKVRQISITLRNCDRKYIFLHSIIDLFHNAVFENGWKPLNYGFVLATLSFCDIAEFLMKNGLDFILGHRFTQDITENIFSQIRRKEGSLPSALKALRAIKSITVSQFISDVKRSSYVSDSDEFLLEFCSEKRKRALETSSNCNSEYLNNLVVNETSSLVAFQVQTLSLDDFSQIMNQYDINSTFYIAGSTTNAVTKHICSKCIDFMSLKNLPNIDVIKKAKSYMNGANRGGLKEPCLQTLSLIFHCEYIFTAYKNYVLKNSNLGLIKCLVDNVDIAFPPCCNIKEKIVKHFFTVRSFCVRNFSQNSKKCKNVFGTASAKRNKN